MSRDAVRRRALAGLLLGAGASHVARPQVYEAIVPPLLGSPRGWVLGSGVAELAVGAGLLSPRPAARRRAALAAAGLFVAVYPANLQMAYAAVRDRRSRTYVAATLVRLPMQVPLVLGAPAVARDVSSAGPSPAR
ncbi:DoxX family protein [Motilibacter aurantiacus]|uniref:DoxX family protein n=1 Tax=Motilibacter aurantiacus TaxID=2714955 RepID=UPI001407E6C2|nr:hypothetical protein [Motilibacter aurantiacus]NHC46113.1 hypothetical protein [Motilibacter aurantiacus]